MGKRKFNTMLDLERVINYYLDNDIPFSLLEDEYDLNLQQRGFIINRISDYSGKVEKLSESIDGEISNDYLNLPHNLKEAIPLEHEELLELFNKREKLKNTLKLLESAIDTSHYDKILNNFDQAEVLKARDIYYQNSATDLDNSSIKYYKKFYSKWLLVTHEKNQFIKSKLQDNKEYQELEAELADINNQLVVHNVKLANWVIRLFFKRMPFEMEEAFGYALEGLSKAIATYDVNRGTHFSTYAVKVIERNIQNNFTNLVGISWPNYILGLNYKRCLQEYISMTHDVNATVDDLYKSNLFGLSLSELKSGEKFSNIVTIPFSYLLPLDPLDLKYSQKRHFVSMEDYQAIDDYEDAYNTNLNLAVPEDEVSIYAENKILESTLKTLLEVLPQDQKNIIRRRYGFDDGIYRSTEQVAKELNVSKDTVYHVDKEIQKYLRHPLQAHLLKDFYEEKEVYGNINSTYRGL